MKPPSDVIVQIIPENGSFPNNSKLPLLLYKKTVNIPNLKAEDLETLFAQNGWINAWRNSIYPFHHYHSNTHEVLGIYKGSCLVQIGGEDGPIFQVETSDVLILPVGVSHKNIGCSPDFKCVGAYPLDIPYDMNYGKPEEKKRATENINKTPLPDKDPVFGNEGPIFNAWKIKD